MSKSAAALLLASWASSAAAMGRRPPAGPAEWRGAFAAETRPSVRVVSSSADWSSLWKDAVRQPAPPADFGRQIALAVFLGSRPTGGWTVEFLEPLEDRGELVLRYKVHAPPPGKYVIEAFTQPYAVKLYPKPSGKVSVAEVKG